MIIKHHCTVKSVDALIEELGAEQIEIFEGTLLDSILMDNPFSPWYSRILALETYINTWTSDYTIYISENDKDIQKLERIMNKLRKY